MTQRSHQQGSLRREGGQWVLRFKIQREEGLPKYRAVRIGPITELRTRPAARAVADQVLAASGISSGIEGKRIKFSDFVPAYVSAHIGGMVRKSSERSFIGILRKHLIPAFGSQELQTIDTVAAQAFVAQLGRSGLSVARIKSVTSLLRRILKAAQKSGYAASPIPPFTLVFPKDAVARPPRRCFSPEESRRIIEAAAWPLKALYGLLAYTGCRVGEALGLDWASFDFEAGIMRIRRAAVGGRLYLPKTAGSVADLPISAPLEKLLTEYKNHTYHRRTELLFENRVTGRPMNASGIRQHHFAPLLKRLGIPHGGLHSFRHGMAQLLFAQGAAPAVVRHVLRHGSLRTTMSYAHSSQELERRGLDQAAKTIAGDA